MKGLKHIVLGGCALCMVACDWPWPFENPDDQSRCQNGCAHGGICLNGQCVFADQGMGVDGALTDLGVDIGLDSVPDSGLDHSMDQSSDMVADWPLRWPVGQDPETTLMGMDYFDGFFYFSDLMKHQIFKMDANTGQLALGWPKSVATFINHPHGIAVDKNTGYLWVCDLNAQEVEVFDTFFAHAETIDLAAQTDHEFIAPVNLVMVDGIAYVASRTTDYVYEISTSSYAVENYWPIPQSNANEESQYIALNAFGGQLYLGSMDFKGVVVVDLEGLYLGTLEIDSPVYGIHVEDSEHIYINIESGVIIINSNGNVYDQWEFMKYERNFFELMVIQNMIYVIEAGAETPNPLLPPHLLIYPK